MRSLGSLGSLGKLGKASSANSALWRSKAGVSDSDSHIEICSQFPNIRLFTPYNHADIVLDQRRSRHTLNLHTSSHCLQVDSRIPSLARMDARMRPPKISDDAPGGVWRHLRLPKLAPKEPRRLALEYYGAAIHVVFCLFQNYMKAPTFNSRSSYSLSKIAIRCLNHSVNF